MNKPKLIFINTITREFIKFAKIMGILPLIYNEFRKYVTIEKFFQKNSFYEYARDESRYFYTLNENLIKRVFLFKNHWYEDTDVIPNTDIFAELFLSHLKDKGYMRYIKIIR